MSTNCIVLDQNVKVPKRRPIRFVKFLDNAQDKPQIEGAIYASCGHKLTGDEGGDGFGFPTITLGDDCDFDGVHRCSFHGSACQKCYDEMKARNMLATTEEADAWIKDGILPERMREPSVNNRDEPHTPDS